MGFQNSKTTSRPFRLRIKKGRYQQDYDRHFASTFPSEQVRLETSRLRACFRPSYLCRSVSSCSLSFALFLSEKVLYHLLFGAGFVALLGATGRTDKGEEKQDSAEVRRTTPAQRTQHSARFFHLKRWFPKLSQTTKSPHELYSTTVGFPTNILHTLGSHYRGQFVHGSRSW